jgi:hypothetical protein
VRESTEKSGGNWGVQIECLGSAYHRSQGRERYYTSQWAECVVVGSIINAVRLNLLPGTILTSSLTVNVRRHPEEPMIAWHRAQQRITQHCLQM